ncbi:hypothetical protein HGO34_15790 [Agrobacterium vitis]|uniref:hypothetical protein n=1 Tax=Agrobacterium vitis TaxID=373 RepID=UPI000871EA49|nr:hypothetical protein [Agrobacterium vitis]MCF1498914.1 hypothetical protein [Allorhizobium sp. Av2]MCM2441184.1 hypothetical protein [Agrobacterium vitis]MCM2452959.1 hypothetical protein [Agrobacterium vitis]MCM2471104.1 hypothetical protein [Agrobacterium vitis]MUO70097.1 hypothetical protein [Agrobacterium vitis]
MGNLFDQPETDPPATQPDPEDSLAKRNKRLKGNQLASSSSSANNKVASSAIGGTISSGKEYSRSTLGAA